MQFSDRSRLTLSAIPSRLPLPAKTLECAATSFSNNFSTQAVKVELERRSSQFETEEVTTKLHSWADSVADFHLRNEQACQNYRRQTHVLHQLPIMNANQTSSQRCSFLTLPPELRNRVYTILRDDGYKGLVTVCALKHRSDVLPSITRVNKQIRAESNKLFCSKLNVDFELDDKKELKACRKWVRTMSEEGIGAINEFTFSTLPDDDYCMCHLESHLSVSCFEITVDFRASKKVVEGFTGQCSCQATRRVYAKVQKMRQVLDDSGRMESGKLRATKQFLRRVLHIAAL